MNGKKVRTVTTHARLKQGLKLHDGLSRAERDADKAVSVWSWTQFYHKPYSCDWQQAYNKACERKWRYTE